MWKHHVKQAVLSSRPRTSSFAVLPPVARDDEADGKRPFSGLFRADDPEGFARLLENGMEVTVRRSEGRIELNFY